MRRLAPVLLAALALLAGGCLGGGDDADKGGAERETEKDREAGLSEQERELIERREALEGVATADQAAFYQLATAAGHVRERASVAVLGRRPRKVNAPSLAEAEGRVRALRPRDRELATLRVRLLPILRTARRLPVTRAAGRRLLRRTDAFSAALLRVVRRDPRFSALVPD